MPDTLTADEQFFYDNAGWSYGPDETPEEGRERNARELALAEAWAKAEGVEFIWEDDAWVDHQSDARHLDEAVPETCEVCTARLGEHVESLGCIDDATDDYRRVVEADLAAELRFKLEGPPAPPRPAGRLRRLVRRLVAPFLLAVPLAVGGLALWADASTLAPQPVCQEDDPCWDCETMGDRICGPVHVEAWGPPEYGWVQVRDGHGRLVFGPYRGR
jgi:hypothetical protein